MAEAAVKTKAKVPVKVEYISTDLARCNCCGDNRKGLYVSFSSQLPGEERMTLKVVVCFDCYCRADEGK
jgi:hypothetical protein